MMTLEHMFFVSQIIAAIVLAASLLFVAHEIRQNTLAIQRDEHNSTMEQWTVIRMAMVRNRDVAELIAVGLDDARPLDAIDQLRLEHFLNEITWAAFHIWDRTQRGIFPKGTFEHTGGIFLCSLIGTRRGGTWWRSAKQFMFHPGFVADVDRQVGLGKAPPLIYGLTADSLSGASTASTASST